MNTKTLLIVFLAIALLIGGISYIKPKISKKISQTRKEYTEQIHKQSKAEKAEVIYFGYIPHDGFAVGIELENRERLLIKKTNKIYKIGEQIKVCVLRQKNQKPQIISMDYCE